VIRLLERKGPRMKTGPFHFALRNDPSAGPNVRCLLAFSTRRRRVFHSLTFLKRFESVTRDLGVMNEQILAAIIRSDEAKTLLFIEPLDRSSCHLVFSLDPQVYTALSLNFDQGYPSREDKYTP